MTEKEQNISKFLQDVFATDDKEIHCREASTQMVLSAEANLSNEASQIRYPALWQHFKVCSDCAQEYELLLALTNLEFTEQLEIPTRIPPLPDGGGPALWKRAKEAVTAVFSGFAPELATAVTRGEELLFAPVEVSLGDGQWVVEFDLAPHEADPQYRDLYITISCVDDSLAKLLDGITLWLQRNGEGPAVHEETLSETDAIFTRVSPGNYSLRWRIAGHEYAVLDVRLP